MKTNQLKERLEELGISQYKLAKKLDIAPTTVNQWFARDSISEQNLVKVCRVLKIEISDFLPYYNESMTMDNINKENNIVYIPRYKNVTASAGNGNYIDNVDSFEEDEPLPVLRQDLPSNRSLESYEAIKVKGKSMLPTFMPNDWVVFDRAINYYNGDGLYVLNYAGNLLIKRLQYIMSSNSIEIISDNNEYSNYLINLTDNQENLKIIGSVVMRSINEA
jgi:phage repressor protein C with HTH and peptisase S24 domain